MDTNPYEAPTSGKLTESHPTVGNRKNAQELFGVVVRGLGLYFIASAVSGFIHVAFLLGGSFIQGPEVWRYARIGFEWLVPGVITFFFPSFVVRMAYRDEPAAEKPELTDDQTDS